MFCPQCGKEVESDVCFCPHCGYKICFDEDEQYIELAACDAVSYAKKPPKKALAALAVVLCALLVASVFFVAVLDNDAGAGVDSETTSVRIDNYLSETAEIAGYGDLANGIMSAEFNSEGYLVFSLSDEISSQYNYYKWTFTDLHHSAYVSTGILYTKYSGESLTKTEPVLNWMQPAAGEYEIKVTCYNTSNRSSATYTGTLLYDDIITKDYVWTYDGYSCSMTISYMFSEYLKYSDNSDKPLAYLRSGGDYSQITRFCAINDVIADMADQLTELYLQTYGKDSSVSGQDFAEFILAFVNICFEYPPNTSDPDGYVYGQTEYFAYPMELIYHGMGDCEDTAILCATLFKACGYDAAVAVIPSHAVAAVVLEDFEETDAYSRYNVSLFSQEIDGKTYYACETTLSSPLYGAGYIDSKFEYDGTNYYNQGRIYQGDYGFFTL